LIGGEGLGRRRADRAFVALFDPFRQRRSVAGTLATIDDFGGFTSSGGLA
jgi:hypothetical protein